MPPVLSSPMSFSAWEMFVHAGPVVRGVMLVLVACSLITWTILIAKTVELLLARRQMQHAAAALDAWASVADGADGAPPCRIARTLLVAVQAERRQSHDITGDAEGVKERTVMYLERLEAAEGRRFMRGTGLLATIGATAPFIGLFGTVWGIMTAFTGIAASRATSLAVVAPGIAEALLATALGLVAAIPAVVIYNHIMRQAAGCRAQVADLTALVMRLVSRDLGREAQGSTVLRGYTLHDARAAAE
ncbi:tonB-system energizer ExbB [Komagataeibacter sp. AV436]|uniref:Biopolymer transport protein ExbB n=1 Tax=Komagataeibacter melomenusus TaxID=2766578 RepID=A0ABX2ACU9_9PROT|nr:tonB-system energizer ExbB [Komagataeibacter melomenusus]MBV1830387.1 tonB-system energizer ExbB [Komagataeibacter melomenusus]NPC66103.1 tonB-system energizer ExbB [Komagataeibacter melomenusus]